MYHNYVAFMALWSLKGSEFHNTFKATLLYVNPATYGPTAPLKKVGVRLPPRSLRMKGDPMIKDLQDSNSWSSKNQGPLITYYFVEPPLYLLPYCNICALLHMQR